MEAFARAPFARFAFAAPSVPELLRKHQPGRVHLEDNHLPEDKAARRIAEDSHLLALALPGVDMPEEFRLADNNSPG